MFAKIHAKKQKECNEWGMLSNEKIADKKHKATAL